MDHLEGLSPTRANRRRRALGRTSSGYNRPLRTQGNCRCRDSGSPNRTQLGRCCARPDFLTGILGCLYITLTLCLWSGVALAAEDPERAFSVALADRSGPQVSLETRSNTLVEIELNNLGSMAWDSTKRVFVSYHWLQATGATVTFDGLRTAFAQTVEPGETVRIALRVDAPIEPGSYLLQPDIVEEGVGWFSQRSSAEPFQIPVRVVEGHDFDLTVLGGPLPARLTLGEELFVDVEIRNDSDVVWTSDRAINLSYHWYLDDGTGVAGEAHPVGEEGRRSVLAVDLAPGSSFVFKSLIAAPWEAGSYLLRFDLVEEGVLWFAQRAPTLSDPFAFEVVGVGKRSAGLPFALATMCLLLALMPGPVGRHVAPLLPLLAPGWVVASMWWKQAVVLEAAQLTVQPRWWMTEFLGCSLVLLLLLLIPTRPRAVIAWCMAAFLSTLILADLVSVIFFDDVGSVAILGAAGQASEVSGSVMAMLGPVERALYADLLPGFFLVLVVGFKSRRIRLEADPRVGARQATVWKIAVSVAALLMAVGAIALARQARTAGNPLRQVFHRGEIVRGTGLMTYHVVDVFTEVAQRLASGAPNEEEYAELLDWFEQRRPKRQASGEHAGIGEGMNLIVIQAEALQAFVVDLEVDGQAIMPNIREARKDSFDFTLFYDQTNHGRTSDAELLGQVSLLPLTRGAAVFRHAKNRFVSLASVVAEDGYSTLSAVAYRQGFWNRGALHRSWAFQDRYFDVDFEPGRSVVGWGLPDRDFVEQMLPRLATLDGPFYAWLTTLSLHHPFTAFPESLKRLDLGRWEGTGFGNYLHAMHHLDRALGDLAAGLNSAGLRDTTVVALFGDHDAGLGEDSELAWAHGIKTDPVSWSLTDRVPFMVWVPETRGRVIDAPGGHIDLAPTLLALLGINPGAHAFLGRNLLGQPADEPVLGPYGTWYSTDRIYLNTGPALEDGSCWAIDPRKVLRIAECAHGTASTLRLQEVSTMILEGDLQQRLDRDLVGHAP